MQPTSATPVFDLDRVKDKAFVKLYRTFDIHKKHVRPLRETLAQGQVRPAQELFIINVSEHKLAVGFRDLAYHHIAQGNVGSGNFLLTFCPVCNSGMLMRPVVDGKLLQFKVGGVYRGTMIMTDRQTGSYWDHVTGKCLHGQYQEAELALMGSHKFFPSSRL